MFESKLMVPSYKELIKETKYYNLFLLSPDEKPDGQTLDEHLTRAMERYKTWKYEENLLLPVGYDGTPYVDYNAAYAKNVLTEFLYLFYERYKSERNSNAINRYNWLIQDLMDTASGLMLPCVYEGKVPKFPEYPVLNHWFEQLAHKDDRNVLGIWYHQLGTFILNCNEVLGCCREDTLDEITPAVLVQPFLDFYKAVRKCRKASFTKMHCPNLTPMKTVRKGVTAEEFLLGDGENELNKIFISLYPPEYNLIWNEDGSLQKIVVSRNEDTAPASSNSNASAKNNTPVKNTSVKKTETKPKPELADRPTVQTTPMNVGLRRTRPDQTETNIQNACRQFLENHDVPKVVAWLDKYVSGQEEAKRMLTELAFEHMARIIHPEEHIPFSHGMVFGPTGCGKTYLCEKLTEILPIPIKILNMTSITETGYSGTNKEALLVGLKEQCPTIEYGIILFDEFDKVVKRPPAKGGGSVSESLQSEFLKVIDGTVLYDGNDTDNGFDTSHVTFLFSGAFDGAFREQMEGGLGFGSEKVDLTKNKPLSECIIEFGIIPELAGRMDRFIPIRALTADEIFDILKKKDNCVEYTQRLFRMTYQCNLHFSEEALHTIAEEAIKTGLGARELKRIVQNVSRSALASNSTVDITPEMVHQALHNLNDNKRSYTRNIRA